MAVPPSWVVGSHISGHACPEIIQIIRQSGGRVEGPDQGLQLGQLSAIHESWFENSLRSGEDDLVERDQLIRTRIRVDANPVNAHVIWDAQLVPARAEIVSVEALAISDHDADQSRMALFLPPQDGRGVSIAAAPADAKALTAIPVECLAFQPPAALPKPAEWTQAVQSEKKKPLGDDTKYYKMESADRSSIGRKRAQAAEVAAKERSRLINISAFGREMLEPPPLNWGMAFISDAPISAPAPRAAPPRLAGPSSVVIDEVVDQESLVQLQLDRLRIQKNLAEQLVNRDQIEAQVLRFNVGTEPRERAERALRIYEKNVKVLEAELHNAEVKVQAFAEAVHDDGAHPDDHGLGAPVLPSAGSPFRGLFDQPSEFAQSAWETGLLDLGKKLEATVESTSSSPVQPQINRLRGSGSAPLITDADTASETTDQP